MRKYVFMGGFFISLIFVFGWLSGANHSNHDNSHSSINRKFYDNETGVTCYIYKDKLMYCVQDQCEQSFYDPQEFFDSHIKEKKPTSFKRNKI